MKREILALLAAVAGTLAATSAYATPLAATSLSFSSSGPNSFGIGSCPSSLTFGSICDPVLIGTNVGSTTDKVDFTIAGDPSGPQNGSVDGIYTVAPGGGTTFVGSVTDIDFSDGVAQAHLSNADNLFFSFTPGATTVPEPVTLSVFAAGLGGLAFAVGWRRNRSKLLPKGGFGLPVLT